MSFLQRCKDVAARAGRLVVKACKSTYAVVAAVLGLGAASSYADGPVIPTTIGGFEISSWVSAGITAIGAVVAVVVGGFFTFLIVKKVMGWARKALG